MKENKFSCEKKGQITLKLPGLTTPFLLSFSNTKFYMFLSLTVFVLSLIIILACFGLKDFYQKNDYLSKKRQIKAYKAQFLNLTNKIEVLDQKFEELESSEKSIQRLFKHKRFERRIKKKKIRTSQKSQELNLETLANLSKRLTRLVSKTLILEENFKVIARNIETLKDYHGTVPSIWPTYGYIRSKYGYRKHPITRKWRFHHGIDIPSWSGAPILATADGVVETSGFYGDYGNLVVLRHPSGFKTMYAHLSSILVSFGKEVSKGEIIGLVGNTGLSTGPHLHYEVIQSYSNKRLAPNAYLELDFVQTLANM